MSASWMQFLIERLMVRSRKVFILHPPPPSVVQVVVVGGGSVTRDWIKSWPNFSKSSHCRLLRERFSTGDIFKNSPKVSKYLGYFRKKYFGQERLQNRPIWSHWLFGFVATPTEVSIKPAPEKRPMQMMMMIFNRSMRSAAAASSSSFQNFLLISKILTLKRKFSWVQKLSRNQYSVSVSCLYQIKALIWYSKH